MQGKNGPGRKTGAMSSVLGKAEIRCSPEDLVTTPLGRGTGASPGAERAEP